MMKEEQQPCVELCQTTKRRSWTLIRLSRLTQLAAVMAIAACSESNPDEVPVQHSDTASGGNSQETKGSENGETGGETGITTNTCGRFDPSNSSCGVCEQSLDEYCDEPDACYLMESPQCKDDVVRQVVERGCGLLKVTWQGDVGDAGTSIWELEKNIGGAPPYLGGELVYYWNNGKRSSGCMPETTVGTEPSCDSWVSQCDGNGLGGAGSTSECYSPKDVSTAYDASASGCDCPWSSETSICVSGAALFCNDGKWVSGEDGPCAPRIDSCDGSAASASDCLDQFETCTENSDGTFCGRSHR